MSDPGGIRVSDAEREAAVERLRVASVEGRLTLGELTERTEAAYTALTQAELAVITADLPGAGQVVPEAAYEPAPQGGRARQWFVAVMGDSKRRGKWRIDQGLGAIAVMGDVVLDLREAEVRTGVVDIVATVVMGDVKIIVPDGVDIEIDGVTIMGDKKVQVIEAPPGMNVPLIRIRAYVFMGDLKVIGDSKAKPVKKPWAAWREQWRELRGELRGGPPSLPSADPQGWRPVPPASPGIPAPGAGYDPEYDAEYDHGDRRRSREHRRDFRERGR